jgi:hypothetical protein
LKNREKAARHFLAAKPIGAIMAVSRMQPHHRQHGDDIFPG